MHHHRQACSSWLTAWASELFVASCLCSCHQKFGSCNYTIFPGCCFNSCSVYTMTPGDWSEFCTHAGSLAFSPSSEPAWVPSVACWPSAISRMPCTGYGQQLALGPASLHAGHGLGRWQHKYGQDSVWKSWVRGRGC